MSGRLAWALAVVALFLLAPAACGKRGSAAPAGTEAGMATSGVRPVDFALRGCPGAIEGPPCAIVRAGGKILVFGAPEGIAGSLEELGIASPDGVFLFSLHGSGVEGLMRLRNTTWQAGRDSRLGLVGPDGTEDLAKALESALSRSDAIIWTKTPPPGGFDIAPLVARDVPPGQGARVFDTGDLTVSAVPAGASQIAFNVGYDGRVLHLSPCDPSRSRAAAADRHVGCYGESADLAWPLPQDDIVLNGD